MTEQTAEQKVRAAWEWANLYATCRKTHFYVSMGTDGRWYGNWVGTEAEAWQSAWEHTESVLEQVRRLQREISALKDKVEDCADDTRTMIAREKANAAAARAGQGLLWARLLLSRAAELGRVKAGLKEPHE